MTRETIMTKNEMLERILNKKAQFACIKYRRTCKVKKHSPVIEKVTVVNNIRIGASYDSIKAVQDKMHTTNSLETSINNKGLIKNMQYIKYPYIVKHVPTGKEYVYINTNKNTKFHAEYYVNGVKTAKSNIEQYLYSSEKSREELPIVMQINLDNIEYVH